MQYYQTVMHMLPNSDGIINSILTQSHRAFDLEIILGQAAKHNLAY